MLCVRATRTSLLRAVRTNGSGPGGRLLYVRRTRTSLGRVPCVPRTVWCTTGAHVAIVLFHGEKCRSCRAFTPKYARLAQQYQGQAEFFRVVATRNADLLASEHVATLLPWCAAWLQTYTHCPVAAPLITDCEGGSARVHVLIAS